MEMVRFLFDCCSAHQALGCRKKQNSKDRGGRRSCDRRLLNALPSPTAVEAGERLLETTGLPAEPVRTRPLIGEPAAGSK
jgi:hypothetical protein